MTPELHRQVVELFEQLCDCGANQQEARVAALCHGDDELRCTVKAMLAADQESGRFLETPPAEFAARLVMNEQLRPLPGEMFGEYQLLECIGKGGMCEVFLAQDTRLGRRAALKFLSQEYESDPAQLCRFEREARAASALNHSNIVTVYGFGVVNSRRYIATEFVEGKTLRDKLSDGRLAVDAVVETAIQTASALGAAHRAGIVHRDIKPENIMLRPDGLVKIVDFGIAKRRGLGGEAVAVEGRSEVPTLPGLLVGTPRYMSPEQARGFPVDARSDLFSLGCVLYEGLTASAAVPGNNPCDVLVALLSHTPLALESLGPLCPSSLAGIVCRALEKDLDKRYQSADEMLVELQSVRQDLLAGSAPVLTAHFQNKGSGGKWQTPPIPEQATAIPKKKARLPGAIVAAVLVAVASTALIYYQRAHQTQAVTETPTAPVPFTSYPGFQRFPSFSPEGARVAFTWDEPGKRSSNIYIKRIGSSELVHLTNDAEGNFAPAWSPDGRLIAFLQAHGPLQSSVMVIPALGGQERELTRIQFDARQIFDHWGWVPPRPYLAWSPDSKWLLALDGSGPDGPNAIVRISIETGKKQPWSLPHLGDGSSDGYAGLAISTDGKTLAFTLTENAPVGEVYTVPLSKELLPVGQPARLTFDRKQIVSLTWAADGRSLVVSSARRGSPELWRIKIPRVSEPERLDVAGYGADDVIVSRTGDHLLYSHGFEDSNIWRISLTGARPAQASEFIVSTRFDGRPSYSEDGKRIAFESNRSGNEEIWICNEDGSDPVQLTSFGSGWAGSPAWSPDGRQIVFDNNASGNWDIYAIKATGGKPVRLTTGSAADIRPVWSRDGKWIYYTSAESGKPRIWRMRPDGGAKVPITRNSAYNAYESRDGTHLYYTKIDGGVWTVPAEGGDEIELWPHVDFNKCAPAEYRLYCIENANGRTTVHILDLKTRSTRVLADVPGPLNNGLTVSPDDRWLLYTKTESVGSELMLVEKFR